MTKLKAFATHVGISLVIFILLAGYIIYFWYPPPFFTSDGGWHGLRIIAAVDVVLGPFLTLIVYRPNKPGLKMDMTIIGLVQAGALGWGLWVVHAERPAAAVFTLKYFSTVTAKSLEPKGYTAEKLRSFGERTPVWIFSDLPTKTSELQKIFSEAAWRGGIQNIPEYYRAFDTKAHDDVISHSLDLAAWVEKNPQFKPEYERFLKAHADRIDEIIFVPWHARYGRSIIALNKTDLVYIASLDILPPAVADENIKYVE